VKTPKPGRGQKKHDAPVDPRVLQDATTGERLIAALQGRFEPTPTTFAELLAGLVELAHRLPKGPLPDFATIHAFAIEQATDAELPSRIEALGRHLAAALQTTKPEELPDLLRKTAAVIESRPLQRHRKTGPMVLAPADPTTMAGMSLLEVAFRKLAEGGRRDIDGSELLAYIRAMPPKDRIAEFRKLGAREDERTLRRKLTELFPELRLAPGRPRKPDK
jgi:hypothetical protein